MCMCIGIQLYQINYITLHYITFHFADAFIQSECIQTQNSKISSKYNLPQKAKLQVLHVSAI